VAEEKIKYRVEIDPRQVEGQLASLRNSIGASLNGSIGGAPSIGSMNSIGADLNAANQNVGPGYISRIGGVIGDVTSNLSSGIQYGAGLAYSASGAISADLSRAQQAFNQRPTFQQATRGITEAGLEFSTAAISTAIPLTAASVGMFGAVNTATGIAAGASLLDALGGELARKGISAAGTLGGMSLNLGSMAASAVMSPVGISMIAASGLGAATTHVGERVIEDFRAGNAMQDILVSRGLSQRGSSTIARGLVGHGRDIGIGGAELTGILEQGLDTGLIGRFGSRPEDIGKDLIQVAKTAKTMMHALKSSIGEAMQHMSELNQMGIAPDMALGITTGAQVAGAATGMGTGVMMRSAGMGARMATTMGLATGTGAGIAMQSLATAQAGLAGFNRSQILAAGDVSGVAQTISGAQMAFMGSHLARGVMAGGGAAQFGSGAMDINSMLLQASGNMAAAGPGGMARFIYGIDRQQSEATLTDQRMMQLGMIRQMSNMFSLDPNNAQDQATLAIRFGGAMGLDVSSTQGRTQAMAMLRGALDPSVGARQASELNARINDLAQNEIGMSASIGRVVRSVTTDPLNAFAGAVSNQIGATTEDVGRRISTSSTAFGRGFRHVLRSIKGAPRHHTGLSRLSLGGLAEAMADSIPVREAASEDFFVSGTDAISSDPEMVQMTLNNLARIGGTTVHEMFQATSNMAGERKTREQLNAESARRGLFMSTQTLSEEDTEGASLTHGFLFRQGLGFTRNLEGKTSQQILNRVRSGMGGAAPSDAAIARGVRNFFGRAPIGESPDAGEQMTVAQAEASITEAKERIGALSGFGGMGLFPRLKQQGEILLSKLAGKDISAIPRGVALMQTQGLLEMASKATRGQIVGSAIAFNLLAAKSDRELGIAGEALLKEVPGEAGQKMKEKIMEIRGDTESHASVTAAFSNIIGPVSKSNQFNAILRYGKDIDESKLATAMAEGFGVSMSTGGARAEAANALARGGPQDKANLELLQNMTESLRIQREFNVALLEFVRGEKLNMPSHPSGSRGR
jgi:hypothetical protein